MKLNEKKSAMALGLFIGGLHLFWSVLVAAGLAQPLLNWWISVHMVNIPVTVVPFDLITAATLVVVSAIVGYVLGYVFATVWNKVHK